MVFRTPQQPKSGICLKLHQRCDGVSHGLKAQVDISQHVVHFRMEAFILDIVSRSFNPESGKGS